MQNNPLVSILINNYNYGRFLPDAIVSALNQTYPHTEIIVVDDGSTDNSTEVIKSYGDKITPILKQNGGQASAFNVGFAASRGEIICFLDADDIFLPEKLSEMVDLFQKYEDIGWLFHPLKFFGSDLTNTTNTESNYTGPSGKYDLRDYVKRGKLKGTLPISGTATSGICFRRSLLNQILPMPEEINITSDDYIKYVALGLQPGFILLEELAHQRIHGNNAYTLRSNQQKLRAKIHILTAYWMEKNFPKLSQFALNTLATGVSLSWQSGEIEAIAQMRLKTYLSSISFLRKLEIYLRAIYYYWKP